jgi:hypothetical protein
MSHALAHGRLVETIIIARIADQEPETVVQALRGLSPVKNLALLVMRSADLSWATAERVLREIASAADCEGELPVLKNDRTLLANSILPLLPPPKDRLAALGPRGRPVHLRAWQQPWRCLKRIRQQCPTGNPTAEPVRFVCPEFSRLSMAACTGTLAAPFRDWVL